MKINWHSNAPWSPTGYGNQTKIFVPRIKKLGYEISVTAFYGLQGGMINTDGIRIYPNGKHPYGQDIIGASALFDGAHAVITLMDIWVVAPQNIPAQIGWFPWYPIDYEPMPTNVLENARKAARGITMSRFGQRMSEQAGLQSFYVPHGVDTDLLRPGDRLEARKRLQWPQDKFILGMVAANKGVPPRKSFFEQIAAFAALRQDKKDVLLYLHTDDGTHGGEAVNLLTYCEKLGLKTGHQRNGPVADDVDVLFPEQYTYLLGLPDVYMVDVYNSLDAMMNVSLGEGFGIPIVEAQSCGCPVIVGDWTSMGELCFSGWKIPKSDAKPIYSPFFEAWQHAASTESIAERIFNAYEMRGNDNYRARARDGALQYDANKVTERYWKPVLAEMAEMLGK